jgi:hypothetical protein
VLNVFNPCRTSAPAPEKSRMKGVSCRLFSVAGRRRWTRVKSGVQPKCPEKPVSDHNGSTDSNLTGIRIMRPRIRRSQKAALLVDLRRP